MDSFFAVIVKTGAGLNDHINDLNVCGHVGVEFGQGGSLAKWPIRLGRLYLELQIKCIYVGMMGGLTGGGEMEEGNQLVRSDGATPCSILRSTDWATTPGYILERPSAKSP